MEWRLGRKRALPAAEPKQQRRKIFRDRLRRGAAYVENFNSALPEDFPVVGQQLRRVDDRHVLRLAQTGQAEAVAPAHGFQQLSHGVDTLVVPLGFDGGDQVFLFPLHKGGEKALPLRGEIQKDFLQKAEHGGKHLITGQGEAVVHKAAVKAGGLVVPHPAHQRTDGSAVQLVQVFRNGAEVGAAFRAPEQHGGDQHILGGFLFRHGAHQLKAQAPLLEPVVPAGTQGHAGEQCFCFDHVRLLMEESCGRKIARFPVRVVM